MLGQFPGAMPWGVQQDPKLLAVVMFSIIAGGTMRAAESDAALAELRATIASIVDVQTQASKELRDWEARKETMADLLDVHRREIALLAEELELSGRSAPGHDESLTETAAEISALRDARAKLTAALERAGPRVTALAGRFPSPLRSEIQSELASLAAWSPGQEPREALQSLLGVLSKAAQFNRRISRSHEAVDGREVEVLYLGLARAFYADRSGNAGIGLPAPGGWQWKPDASLNRQILRAFEILDQKRPPARIELPLHVE